MPSFATIRPVLMGLVIGGLLGFAYHKLVGCRTGTCPLTATPLRSILYGAVIGLLFTLPGCSKRPQAPKESAMSTSNVIHITSSAFDKVKSLDKPVLVDFWAPWCGPCRTQLPILDQVAAQVGDTAVVGKVNVDEERDLAFAHGIQSIPTLMVMKQGKVVQRFSGVQSAETLVRALEEAR